MPKIKLLKSINVHGTPGLVFTLKADVELDVTRDEVFGGYIFEKDGQKFFVASYEAILIEGEND